MTRPDSGAVDAAIVGVLQADGALKTLMPDGVFFNLAAPGSTRFVLVGVFDEADEWVFGHRATESTLYFVKAVGFSRNARLADMKAAAFRIDALLDGATLTVPGFASVDCVREKREPTDTVPDPLDPSVFWFHFGGHYRVLVAWPDPVPAA